MNAFIFQAAIYCEACGNTIRANLARCAPVNPDDEFSYDSDDYPKGPFADGGGEADIPQHCDECEVFLENPLTREGLAYVRDRVAPYPAKRSETEKQWMAFYQPELFSAFVKSLYCYDGSQGREFGQDYTRSGAVRIAAAWRKVRKVYEP